MFSDRKLLKLRKKMMVLATGMALAFPFGSCNFDEITTTSTVDTRVVVQSLVKSWVLTPIETFVNDKIDGFFDHIAGD